MPALSAAPQSDLVKLLLLGDSGSGKTGALASLAAAGYKLRILDMDNGVQNLAGIMREKYPAALPNVDSVLSYRDNYVATPAGPVIQGAPKAFIDAMKALDQWKDGDKDFGKPATWGSDVVVVVDSLTMLSEAAYSWAEMLVPRSKDGKFDPRQVYGNAQDAIEKVLATLTSPTFQTNVIVISHVRYMDMPDGSKKAYPTAVGQALGPTIPRYFNSMAQCETMGGRRTIKTAQSAFMDLKNPSPFRMAPSLPIETGLADFFKTIKGK